MSDDVAAPLTGSGPAAQRRPLDATPVVLPGRLARTGRVVQRIAAYGLAADGERVLLVRASDRSDVAGAFSLPGGGLRHGEHPREAVVREVAEETGLHVAVTDLVDVLDDVVDLPHAGLSVHTVRVVYRVRPAAGPGWGTPRPEADGSSDDARFVSGPDVPGLPLLPFVARVLLGAEAAASRPHPPVAPPRRPPVLDDADAVVARAGSGLALLSRPVPSAAPAEIDAAAGEPVPLRPPRVQRPAAYALIVRPASDGRPEVLLSRLRGAEGLWTLPGGGIEPGEAVSDAVRREVYEETGQRLLGAQRLELLDVDSRTFTGYGPDGRLEDFHGVRVVYRGAVAPGVPARVVEVGGSTDAAAWFDAAALARLPLTSIAQRTLRGAHELRTTGEGQDHGRAGVPR